MWRRAVSLEPLFRMHSGLWMQRQGVVAREPRRKKVKAVLSTRETEAKIKP